MFACKLLSWLISIHVLSCGATYNIWNNYYLDGSEYTGVIHQPTTEEEISTAVTSCFEKGTTIKVVGAGHSPNNIGRPDKGELMSLVNYKDTLRIGDGTATFEAGITLLEMGEELEKEELTFQNPPTLLEFTLGGVVATGSTGPGLTSFCSNVVEMRLVIGNGTVIEVSENHFPDIFKAAQIGVGYMGIISTVTVKTVPLFRIKKVSYEVKANEIPAMLPGLADERYLIFYSGDTARVETYSETTEDISPAPGGCHAVMPDDCVDVSYKALTYTYETYNFLIGHFGFIDSEAHVVIDDGSSFLSDWMEAVNKLKDGFPGTVVSSYVRPVNEDSIWLSPVYGINGRSIVKTGSSLLTNSLAAEWEYMMEWRKLAKKYKATFHWGKITPLTVSETKELFPKFSDFAEQRLLVDETGVFLNDHGKMFFSEDGNAPEVPVARKSESDPLESKDEL